MKIGSKVRRMIGRLETVRLVEIASLFAFVSLFAAVALFLDSYRGSAQPAPNSCIKCHSILPDERLSKPAQLFEHDIHKEKGLTCTDCHGGDATKDDKAAAKSPMTGYSGKPDPTHIPAFCGKCHSDANLMKRFDPSLRVDQVQEYFTSVHGQRLQKGDKNVATCVSCHGIHGIRPPDDPASTVFALNVAETCSKCHADQQHMQGYGIPTDQYAKYKTSVHANALYEKHDLSAPTCNDCHGNHGAQPPGLESVANVCGQCHGRQAELFRQSPHKQPFDTQKLGECLRCHSNHAVLPPNDAMAGVGQGSTCTQCHQNDKGFAAARRIGEGMENLQASIHNSTDILERAERAGMEVSKPQFELKEANDALTQARVLVHTASADQIEGAITPGLEIAAKTYQAGEGAFAELAYRRKGLVVSLFFILFLAGLVYLKVRQIEGKYPFGNSSGV